MFFHQSYFSRVLLSIPVFLVLAAAACLEYCYITEFLLLFPVEVFIVPTILFHFTLFVGLWSYFMCITTDPGTIPDSFQFTLPDPIDAESLNQEDFRAARITLCEKCNLKRPPRTHHCSQCNRCILRMDHHCPWVGNCVGFKNHRFFIQFLVYIACTCINLGFSFLSAIQEMNWEKNVTAFICCIIGFSFGLSTSSLAMFHIYLAASNKTTLEINFDKKYNIFDTQSIKSNCFQIFGDKKLGFFFPLKTGYAINGVVYPLRLRNLIGEPLLLKDKLVE